MIVGEDTAVPCRIVQARREQGHVGAAVAVGFHQLLNGFGPKQGNVSIQDQQFPGKALKRSD